MIMDKLEKVEKLRAKTGVSYEDAKNALEACDYDLLDAIIYLEKLDKETINRNEQLAEFIEVLEDKMPATFILSSLNATEEGITLTCTVEKKEEAAVVIDELSKFSHFGFVDTTAVNELKTEIGEIMYTFQVDITYAPIIDENAEEEAAEAGEE